MEQQFSTTVDAKRKSLKREIQDTAVYKELVIVFVKRYFSTLYKQTILGPAWIIINPLVTTLVFSVIFGNVAQLSTDGLPKPLFYMLGNTTWLLFSTTVLQNASSFTSNSAIFSKVYFPRLVVSVATTMQSFLVYLIQFSVFILFLIGYLIAGFRPVLGANWPLLFLLPALMLLVSTLGVGIGLIISSLTTKYRDLNVLVAFAIQLWMYATPIVYPLSELSVTLRKYIMFNPMSSVVEAFREIILGEGHLSVPWLIYSTAFAIVTLIIGLRLFSRIEKTFVDTI